MGTRHILCCGQSRLSCLLAVLLIGGLALWAAGDRMGRYTLNPKTYKSPSGEYELWVNPSTIYGQGEGEYRGTRGGAEIWAKKLPFTLWEAEVTNDGVVAGYAYSGGMENYVPEGEEGRLHLVIIDPQGTLRMNEVLPRRGVFSCTSTVDRDVTGFMLDPENDRFIVRCREGGWSALGETWRFYRLSDGGFLDEYQFAHPEEGEHEFWQILGTEPVAGTPLILVNWKYIKWSEDGNGIQAVGGCFALIDSNGKLVWEHDSLGDYPEYYDYDRRLDDEKDREEKQRLWKLEQEIEDNGAILSTEQAGRFDVWFVKESQRVTFEVAQDSASGWRVAERSRADHVAAIADAPEKEPEKLEPLSVRHIGTIELEPATTSAPEIREIADFEFDDLSRIGILRRDSEVAFSMLLLRPDGTLAASLSLGEELDLPELWNAGLAWIGSDQWILSGTTWDEPTKGKRIPVAHAWSINMRELSHRPIANLRDAMFEAVAGNGRGGFVAVIDPQSSEDERTYVVACDGEGKEMWRFVPDSDWLDGASGLAVTSMGLVFIPCSYGSSVTVLTADGEFQRYDDCRSVFGDEGNYIDSIASDREGGLYIKFWDDPIWQVRSDWSYRRKLWTRHTNGRKIHVPDDGVRVDPGGNVWITDGQCLMRLDQEGAVDRILGESPESPELRRVGGVAIDQEGTIYIAEERNGITHVFDSSGRRVRMLRPNPQDFEDAWGVNIDVAGNGSVFIGGLEFSPSGERVGFRKLPDGVEELDLFLGGILYQPRGPRYWVISQEEAMLAHENNTVVRNVKRRPNGNWLNHISASGITPDGSLVLAADSFNSLGFSADTRETINLYTPSGDPVKTVEFPNMGETRPRWGQLAYNGRYILTGPWGYENPRYLLADTDAEPPRWYDLGALVPYEDRWHYFFVKDGAELWMFAEEARKVERFEVPAPGSLKPAGTNRAQSQPAAESDKGQVTPVVYARRYKGFGHPPLSEEQIDTILRTSTERNPEGQGIWFIYALANWDVAGRREGVVDVFFTPSMQSPRLRKGTFVRMTTRPPPEQAESEDMAATIVSSLRGGPRLGPSQEYWQVSQRTEPFGDSLEVPTPPLIPFARPEGFAEDEVVALVDFVRSSPWKPHASENSFPVPERVDGSLPILSIEQKGGVVEIRTGALEGPLAGAGEVLRIRKKDDGTYELLEAGIWVS